VGLRLALAILHIPEFIQRRELEKLFELTAASFQASRPPDTSKLSLDDLLKSYAVFTREQADLTLRESRAPSVQSALFESSRLMGAELKTQFGLKSTEDVMQMSSAIYKLLKIDLKGTPDGNIVVKRCFFSPYYSQETCRLISSLDEGLLAGLSAGGRLKFSQRLTEGCDSCRAYLAPAGPPA
jgi:hypothetical protein